MNDAAPGRFLYQPPDITDAVTAVKGSRAHERAVALRSLFQP